MILIRAMMAIMLVLMMMMVMMGIIRMRRMSSMFHFQKTRANNPINLVLLKSAKAIKVFLRKSQDFFRHYPLCTLQYFSMLTKRRSRVLLFLNNKSLSRPPFTALRVNPNVDPGHLSVTHYGTVCYCTMCNVQCVDGSTKIPF